MRADVIAFILLLWYLIKENSTPPSTPIPPPVVVTPPPPKDPNVKNWIQAAKDFHQEYYQYYVLPLPVIDYYFPTVNKIKNNYIREEKMGITGKVGWKDALKETYQESSQDKNTIVHYISGNIKHLLNDVFLTGQMT